MTALLRCEHLRVSYPCRLRGATRGALVRAVDGVTLEVAPGELLGLAGESGCGKSSLARALVRLGEIESGSVWFEDQEISRWPEPRLRPLRRHLQLLFQDSSAALDPRWTVARAIAEPLRTQGKGGPKAQERDLVRALLAKVHLEPGILDRFPHELSGGERQRVALARALATEPRLLVADEPWSGLDASTQAETANLLLDLRQAGRLGCLLISHDLGLLTRIADRIAVMYLGRLVEVGPAARFAAGPLHPYAQSLWAAASRPSEAPVAGEAPSALAPPSGCRFHPRCPRGDLRCREAEPPAVSLPDGHTVFCFHPLGDSYSAAVCAG